MLLDSPEFLDPLLTTNVNISLDEFDFLKGIQGRICRGQLNFHTVQLNSLQYNYQQYTASVLFLTLHSLRECHNSAK